jgi:DNA-binding MarR family transcriptional regulator
MLAAAERTGNDVVPFTHEELAAMLGAGRSHTTRVLREFSSRDLVETRRGSVLLRNHAALKEGRLQLQRSAEASFRRGADRRLPSRRQLMPLADPG